MTRVNIAQYPRSVLRELGGKMHSVCLICESCLVLQICFSVSDNYEDLLNERGLQTS